MPDLIWSVCLLLLCSCGRSYARGTPPSQLKSTAQYSQLMEQIRDDLGPWLESGITTEMVERAYCTDFEKSLRFQVVNGEMYIAGEFEGFMEFNKMTKLWILDVAKHYPLPDVDIIMSTADGCPPVKGFTGNWTQCQREAPLFTFDRKDSETHCVRYPDHTMYSWPTAGLPSWEDVRYMMDQSDPVPWQSRDNTMLFRGAQTGMRYILDGDADFVNHELTDFRTTGWTGATEAGQYVTLPAHCLHRYLLHLPGQAYSARLKYLMYCNSTVLFAGMEHKEFWYNLLEDGKNVILLPPLEEATRGQAILKALEDLNADPAKAERIAAAGFELVSNFLAPDVVRRYFYELLLAYSKLQKFKPTRHPQAIPFKYSALGPDPVNTINTRECGVCAWNQDADHLRSETPGENPRNIEYQS